MAASEDDSDSDGNPFSFEAFLKKKTCSENEDCSHETESAGKEEAKCGDRRQTEKKETPKVLTSTATDKSSVNVMGLMPWLSDSDSAVSVITGLFPDDVTDGRAGRGGDGLIGSGR